MFDKESNVLIAGGLGFVGSNLARFLVKEGYVNITLLSRSRDKIANIKDFQDKITLVIDDVTNIEKYLEKADVLFYFISTTDNYAVQLGKPHRDSEVNVLGTSYLLDAIKRINPDIRLIYGSTFFTVGQPLDLPVTEQTRCNPLSLYGATRLCGENLTRIYQATYGLNAVIIRFTNLYGPFERSANPKKAAFNWLITKAIRNETMPMYGDGTIKRDYLFVEDAVRGAFEVARSGTQPLYFIGSGQPVKLHDLLSQVIEIVGSGKIERIPIPKFHQRVGIRDFWVDNKRISGLGWVPEISLKEGIKRTVNYYRKNSELWVE